MPDIPATEDLTGRTFGDWAVLAYAGQRDSDGRHRWTCRCKCGRERPVMGYRLLLGETTDCGCDREYSDGGIQAGQRYGRLVTVERKERPNATKAQRLAWLCRCDCGREHYAISELLRSGKTRSCGCLRRDSASTHGLHGHPLYPTWQNMKARCNDPTNHNYVRYGALGVKVCGRWMDSFEDFIADVGDRPTAQHSLDRFPDGTGNYEPGNVRWATKKEQSSNTKTNVRITFRGETLTVTQWAERIGMRKETLWGRIYKDGLTVEEAITRPLRMTRRTKPSSPPQELS